MAQEIIVKPTETVEWNDVYTIAAHNYLSDGYADQFYDGRPLLKLLRERGKKTRGGAQLVERVNLGSRAKGGSYGKGHRSDLIDVDPFTAARYSWAYYKEPVVMYLQDEQQSKSDEAKIDLLQLKIKEAGERMRDQISEHLCATTKALTTDVNTLVEAFPADPTTSGAFGGLDGAASAQPVWRNKTHTAGTAFSSVGLDRLRSMALDCSHGGKYSFDAVLLPQTYFEEYLDFHDNAHTFDQRSGTKSGTKTADLGASAASFMQRPVFYDPDWSSAQSSSALVLNFDGVQLVEDPRYAFKMTKFMSALVDGVDARVAWIRWVGQLTVSNRRTNGIITNIS